MICVHGSLDPDECAYCPPRLPERCEACTDGRCAECNRASWCNCECEGAVEPGDVSMHEFLEDKIHG